MRWERKKKGREKKGKGRSLQGRSTMDVPNGVEKDDFSRFVDYTCATPFEQLVSDIAVQMLNLLNQNAVPSLESIKFDYQGSKLVLALNDNLENDEIGPFFPGIGSKYILLAREYDEWPDSLTPSRRLSILSALIQALSACNIIDIPVFLATSTLDKIEDSRNILGYKLMNRDTKTVSHQYESTLIEGIDYNHEICYIDGIKKLFYAKYSRFYNNLGNKSVVISINEEYKYKHRSASISAGNMDSELASETSHESSIKGIRGLYRPSSGIRNVSELIIKLSYSNIHTADSIVDNWNYTNLLPSKQPPSCWHVRATYKNINTASKVDSEVTLCPLSNMIRKYTCYYIQGKVCKKGVTLGYIATSASSKNESFDSKFLSLLEEKYKSNTADTIGYLNQLIDLDKSVSIAAVLSPETQLFMRELVSMCNNAIDNNNIAPQMESLIQSLFECDDSNDNCSSTIRGSSLLGSWIQIFAFYAGLVEGGIIAFSYFWGQCLRRIRLKWEDADKSARIPFIHSKSHSDSHKPLSDRLLWDDQVDLAQYIPDTTQPLLMQKLQMLLFCMNSRGIRTWCECPSEYLDKVCTFPASVEGGERQQSVVTGPSLLRRLPMTEDSLAQHKHITKKMISGKSRSVNENPLLFWQISMPSLVSDMRSFKHANAAADFITFLEWYLPPGGNADVDTISWSKIWEEIEGCSASEQRAIYRGITEGEKVLEYFVNISPIQLIAECTTSSLCVVYHLLLERLMTQFPSLSAYIDADDVESSLLSDSLKYIVITVKTVKSSIEIVLSDVKTDVIQYGVDEAEAAVNQQILVALDKIAKLTEEIEVITHRAIEVRMLLGEKQPLTEELVANLVIKMSSAITCKEESVRVYETAKRMSKGEGGHSWHSFDGRELGAPSVKEILISNEENAFNLHGIIARNNLRISFTLPS